MARLNEPPVIGESIEALKRRFMRQNRELAISNSELKIKVATLEADKSQLLSENITLRDSNIHLKQKLARDSTNRVIENVGKVKERLLSKAAELTELMRELDADQIKPVKLETEAKAARRKSFKKSPTQVARWRSGLYGPEVTGLAPIVEGKHFPRRTLGEDDIKSLQAKAAPPTSSPDLSPVPPPVAHFEPNEQIPVEITETEHPTETIEKQDNEDPARALFTNLEARRKRRTSALIREPTEAEEEKEQQEPAKESQAQPSIKTGAKRKYAAQESDTQELRPAASDNSTFVFSRKSSVTTDKPISRPLKALPDKSNSRSEERIRSTAGEVRARKALGEKTVNTDPVVSPVKSRTVGDKANQADVLSRIKERQKQRENSKSEPIKPAPPPLEIPPTTPASLDHDLLSPTESIASAEPGRTTPVPSELTSKVAENGRASRRPRAQVSYAEPSLRDKMRRPGKELADAVVPEKHAKEESKQAEIPRWKISPSADQKRIVQPTSPLQNKSSSVESNSLSPLLIDRRRRSVQPSVESTSNKDSKADTSLAVKAALVTSQKRLSRVQDQDTKPSADTSNSDLFGNSSSSLEGISTNDAAVSAKQTRRHSSMANLRTRNDEPAPRPKSEIKLDNDELLASRAERTASRRRSMQL